jgi:hypothetical protein
LNLGVYGVQIGAFENIMLSPDFGRGFLLPKKNICNKGEVVILSETVEKP